MSASPTGYSHTMRVVAGSNPLDLMPPTSNTVPGLSSTRLATGDQRIAPRWLGSSSARHRTVAASNVVPNNRLPNAKVSSPAAGASA